MALTMKIRPGDRIHIGEDVVIAVTRAASGKLNLQVDAPPHVGIIRKPGRPEAAPDR